MSDEIPFYFPGATYHTNKKHLDELFLKHDIEYNADSKSWVSDTCKVVGTFNGYKRHAVLSVEGDDAFIKDMKIFADSVGAEIRDVAVRDIRNVRKKQGDEKRIKEEAEKVAFEKAEKDRMEGIESVIRCKLDNMENLSAVFQRNWIMKELGVDISERLGIEPDKSIKKFESFKKLEEAEEEEIAPVKKAKPKAVKKMKPIINKTEKTYDDDVVKQVATSVSLLCKIGKHDTCGGFMCSCDCHKEKAK
ncbi:MAG: hypothetical protein KKD44_26635 [Proteobacteria bacterium]|nr:hypothetical protein [Pseudomonadota bacterium]